jgi:hypothetical protein
MGYILHCFRNLPCEQFKAKSAFILDHPFGDHSHCSFQLCKPLKRHDEGKEMSEEERLNKYGSTDDPKYLAFKSAWVPYFTGSALQMVHHLFSLQKNESLHRKVMQFAPTDKHYCGTFSLFNRMNLVVIEDLNGLEQGLKKVHELLILPTNSVF